MENIRKKDNENKEGEEDDEYDIEAQMHNMYRSLKINTVEQVVIEIEILMFF